MKHNAEMSLEGAGLKRSTQRRLIRYLVPHSGTLAAGLLCAAGNAAVTGLFALAIKLVINNMTHGQVGRLNFVCIAVVLVFVVKGLFAYGQAYFLSIVSERVAARLRGEIFAHLHSLSLSFFNQRRTGAIMSTVTNDVPVIQAAALSIRDIITAPITIVVSFSMLFYHSWRLTTAAIVLVPIMGVVIWHIGKRMRRISDVVQLKMADISTIVEETLAGVRIIKSFAAEDHEILRFSRENESTYRAVIRGVKKRAQLRPIIEFLGAFGIALVIFLGGNEVAHNTLLINAGLAPASRLDAGSLAMFIYLLQQIARAVSDVGSINATRQSALAAAARIFEEVLDQSSELTERDNAITLPPVRGEIRFDHVDFAYSNGVPVLKDVNFSIAPGEVVALVGLSGAGKSTIADLIPRFYDVQGGGILIDGVDVRDAKLGSVRSQIGIVPQETWLFAGPLRDNIMYGKRDASDLEIQAAVNAANAYFIAGMQDGLDTIVGERGIRLSGGERQRIAIARAILMDPRILILDEATSSLDASSEALVQEALDKLMRGRTTLIIAHRLSTILSANRIMVMEDGRIVESGSHSELVTAGGLYSRLYERQFRAEVQN